MEQFPFPGRELAENELSRDPCFNKIRPEDVATLADDAWKTGEDAANAVWEEQNGCSDFDLVTAKSGLTVKRIDKDKKVGNRRFFSDYYAGKGEICLYTQSVALWAKQNKMNQQQAENMILMHEYFHFLEWTKLGLSSKNYLVPMIVLFGRGFGKTGVLALSEIGAHAFAYTYYYRAADSQS